jgi:hypothetical protein
MMSIFSDMIEKIMEVFMNDFSIYGKTFDDYLENLDKVLQRCVKKHLVLNWEKCHFMVRGPSAWTLGVRTWDRGRSCKDRSDREFASSHKHQRGTKFSWLYGVL